LPDVNVDGNDYGEDDNRQESSEDSKVQIKQVEQNNSKIQAWSVKDTQSKKKASTKDGSSQPKATSSQYFSFYADPKDTIIQFIENKFSIL